MSISSLFNIARHNVQLVRQGRVALLFVISLTLLTTPLDSSASGNVAPILNTSAPPLIKYYGYVSNFDTPEAACIDFVAHQFELISATNLVYDHVAPSAFERYPPENFYVCFARWTTNGAVSVYAVIPIRRSCDGTGWVNHAIMCTKHVCPANATGAPEIDPTMCTCNEDYEPDASGTSCVPVTPCPVPALTPLPADDACAQALENINTTQAQKDAACGALTSAMQSGKSCLANKLSNLATPVPLVVTADIRSIAYQAHLREIWDTMEDLAELEDDPDMQAACAARRAAIAAEKGCDNAGKCTSCYPESATQRSHCLKARPANPSPNDALHTQGKAIDVSEGRTIAPLQSYLSAVNPPQNVQQFLNAPTNCNLNWGGTFIGNPDSVHFYVP